LPQEGPNVEDARRNSTAGKFQQENMKLMKDMKGNYQIKSSVILSSAACPRVVEGSVQPAFSSRSQIHLGTRLWGQLHCRFLYPARHEFRDEQRPHPNRVWVREKILCA
jgi:hypothetical protein